MPPAAADSNRTIDAELRARAEALVPLLRAEAAATERARRMGPRVETAMHDAGLFRLMQPARVGGYERDHRLLIDVAAILARGCPSSAWVFANLAIHASMLGYFPAQAQADVWDGDPGALACMSVIYRAGRAHRVAGGYRLSGRWPFCSGIDQSRWHIVAAIVAPEGDAAEDAAEDAAGDDPGGEQRLFLVPRADWTSADNWDALGLAGTGSHDVAVADAFVPAHRTLAEADTRSGDAPGNAVNPGPLFRLPMQAVSSTAMAGVGLGTAEGAWADFVAATRARAGTFAGDRIAGLQNLQIRIADAGARIDAAGLVLRRNAAAALAIAAAGGRPDLDARMRWRRDCAFAIGQCRVAVDSLFEAAGGAGLANANPLSRQFRDIHAIAAHIAYNRDAAGAIYGRYRLGIGDADADF